MQQLIDTDGRFAKLIEPTISGMGYELVRVRLTSASKGLPTLQIMVEYPDGRSVNVDDCTKISRALSALLEVEDPFEDAYNLELSSCGVPRPLTRHKHFAPYIGFEIKCELAHAINNRRRFRGILKEVNDETLIIEDSSIEYELAFAQLSNAAPVYSDALLQYELSRNVLPKEQDNAELDDQPDNHHTAIGG